MATFIVRHAATALNHADERQSRIRAGGPDVPPSKEGQAHIAKLAQFFKGKPIHGVFSSDTRRAGETGQAIAAATGAPFQTHPGLRPWHLGSLAGQKVGQVEHLLAKLYQEHHTPAPGGGESFKQFYERYAPAVKAILADPKKNHVIVTHGRNVKTLWSLLKGKGHLDSSFPAHDPRPTTPGDVYLVHPEGLTKVFATGAPKTGTRGSS